MKTSEQINELAEALSLAQGKIQNPKKDSDNPFFKSKYADLAEVLDVVRPAFSEVGLSVVQMPYTNDGMGVVTRIMHKSGQWIEGEFSLPMQTAKNIAQDAGSLITYMRRYALAAAAGVFQEDPDANLGNSKSDNTGAVVNMKYSPKEISNFGDQMSDAIDAGDHLVVGRSLSDPEMVELWGIANKGTTKTTGQFTSEQKAKQSNLVSRYRQDVQRWADDMVGTGDTSLIMETWNDLDRVDKAMAWNLINEDTRSVIRAKREAS